MLYETLQILKEQLDGYLDAAGLGKIVILDNIAMLESGSDNASDLEGKVIISLLNIDEEKSLKNIAAVQLRNNQAEYKNPPIHISMYFIVSAYCDSYDNSLLAISKTMEFFQGKKLFTSSNTIFDRTEVSEAFSEDFKFVVDLYTPGFEIWNQIWSNLGGRQLPSVIYQVKLLEIDAGKSLGNSAVITQINGTLNEIN